MSMTKLPDPEARNCIAEQGLTDVLHPLVQHRSLEQKQMVVTGGQGSTIVDADDTTQLDKALAETAARMAGRG